MVALATPTTQQQWYVKWALSGTKWTGAIDGPFPMNEAPVCGAIQSGGKTYPECTGPYTSQAAAQAFIKAHPNGPPPESSIGIGFPSIPNPFAFLAWLQEIGHFIGLAVAYITDGPMWRSIGWIALGFLLLLSGVIQWVLKGTDVKSVAELGALLAV